MQISKIQLLFTFVAAATASNASGFSLSNEVALGATSPFLHSTLPNYDQHGAVDISPGSILFGKRQPNLGGAIWSKIPSEFTDWQIHAKIQITGEKLGGEGMALWYSKDRATGPVMGGADLWTGLGILIDTYDDDGRGNNPAIMGILNNGTTTYNHAQDGEGQYFAGCLRNVRNLASPLTLRVTYVREMLRVELDDSTDGREFVNCFERVGIKLPAGYFFGVSGMTNSYPDGLELLDLKVYGGRPLSEDHNNSKPAVASNQDHRDISAQIEKALAGQLRQYMPKIISGHSEDAVRKVSSSHLSSLDDRIKSVGDTLSTMQQTIAGLAEQLHHNDQSHLGEELHHLGEELKARLDGLRGQTTLVQQEHATLRKAVEPTSTVSRYGSYLMFMALQVAILAGFLAVKQRMDKREKKWM
ncbi:hypothetical protein PSACC_02867 [Paramicrosporidium saccamoebae]|uniref:L-type lectin-like domain-containing protein n=1 Tax=Paramicrosporidium saccamoebae TaxID=1246581 RepID=A0A2H9THT2_9FUNG|nr:hypothetical protein PSACC_02867 [Paramicrosporidium saccamoebae]